MVNMSKQVITVDANQGQYKVCGKLWTVGHKYILHELVGAGSYGDVCRTTDVETNQLVALKRIPDVLSCPLLAKRVLREVCIMRRLSHPFIISLTDVFTKPSSETRGGLDLYIATEFADWGDMYHLREPITSNHVKILVWQLLVGLKYMHSCRVWHRDIKSENVLLTSRMRVKICDFGLSRSAEEADFGFEPKQAPADSRARSKKVLTRQYTKMVVTPSYRAPEVIMSKGQYNSTIDIWSVGCIFWELLIRSATPGSSGPPAYPLFGVRGEPTTPQEGASYVKDGHSTLAEQLDVIFNVIGTPCWEDIESIPSGSWRAYLKNLAGRAGNLVKNLSGFVDDEAIDLLSRMLAFNPVRRCTADEALSHVYFKNVRKPTDARQVTAEDAPSFISTGSLWKIRDPAAALAHIECELEASEKDHDGGRQKLEWLLQREVEQQQQENLIRRSFLCSYATAKLHLLQQQREATTSRSAMQNFLAQGQAVQLAAQTVVPAPVQYMVNHPASSQQVADSCPSDSHVVTKSKNSIVQNSGQPSRKRALPRKTIIRQGSLRIEINRSSAELPTPNTNTRLTRAMASAGMPLLGKQQEPNKATSNLAAQSGSESTAKEKITGNCTDVNGMNIGGVKNLQEMFIPRRSPRIQEEASGIPAAKRIRSQAG